MVFCSKHLCYWNHKCHHKKQRSQEEEADEPLSEKDIPVIVKAVLEALLGSSNQSSMRREEEGMRLPVNEGDTAVDTGGEYAMRALLAVFVFFCFLYFLFVSFSVTCVRTCQCCMRLYGCVGGVHLYIQSLAACML